MPNRIIKESILTSESFNSISPKAQSFFVRLIVRVDDFGRFEARTAVLRAALYPLCLDKVGESAISEMIHELVSCGMIMTYQVDGKPYLQMVNWAKYQQLRAKNSKYPPMQTSASRCNQVQSQEITCEHIRSESESESESETESDTDTRSLGNSGNAGTAKRAKKYPADGEWISNLKSNPAYSHINLDAEIGKMTAWLQTPKGRGRQMTRQFILSWLNKVPAPVNIQNDADPDAELNAQYSNR